MESKIGDEYIFQRNFVDSQNMLLIIHGFVSKCMTLNGDLMQCYEYCSTGSFTVYNQFHEHIPTHVYGSLKIYMKITSIFIQQFQLFIETYYICWHRQSTIGIGTGISIEITIDICKTVQM